MSLLGELNTPTVWTPTAAPPPANDMAALFSRQGAINKFEHYLAVYDTVFRRYRHQDITLIEIGVGSGGSLQLWRDYFTQARIIGLDHRTECKRFEHPAENVHVRIGQQQDTAFLDRVVGEFGAAHIIIDDGSHRPAHMRTTFTHLFVNGLLDGGVYLVEDLSHCYFRSSLDGTPPFTELLKELIDVIHNPYQQLGSCEAFLDGPPALTVPLATTLIPSLHIYDGIAVIYRERRDIPRCVLRLDP